MPPSPSKVHFFAKSLNAEAAWLPKVQSLLPGCPLTDVTKDAFYQPLGVDFLVAREDGQNTGLECKFDSYDSGNLALEWVSSDRPQIKDGWMLTCRAGWLAYLFTSTGDMLVLKLSALRQWLAQNYSRFDSTSVANRGYFSYCSLVPLNDLAGGLGPENCLWADMRAALPEEPFKKPVMASKGLRLSAANPQAIVRALREGPRASAQLRPEQAWRAALFAHLEKSNRLRKKHSEAGRPQALLPLAA